MRLTLVRRMPGVTANKIRRLRKFDVYFNNAWQVQREIKVEDQGYREACESKGIRVYSPEEIIRPHLPDLGTSQEELEEYQKVSPILGPIEDKTKHTYYHERPCKTFNGISRLIKYEGLNQAKVLTNTVEIENGLPKRINDTIKNSMSFISEEDGNEILKNVLLEARVFDPVQKKLPRNVAVPNVNWNPVLDRMHRPLPYPEGPYSWGWSARREYGIPEARKNLGLVRSLLYAFDLRGSVKDSKFLSREYIEKGMLRQFFEKDGSLVQIKSPLPLIVADEKPLQPYADANQVASTTNIELPNLSPLNCLSYFFDTDIYNHTNSFPLKQESTGGANLHFHTCFEINNSINKVARLESEYNGRSLIMAFASAMAQARMKYGADVKGQLPKPICVHFVNTDGKKFHFSVFQLNTLDLEGPVKNIFWHEPVMENLYEACDYMDARPHCEGFNQAVFRKLLALYWQNT